MTKIRGRVAVLAVALVGQSLAVLPAQAQDEEVPRVEVLADELESPRGLTVDADGTVYVVESGTGGDDHCVTEQGEDENGEPFEFEICFGLTAGVTRIAPDGTVTRDFVADLPSYEAGEGEYIGASDVAIGPNGSLYITMGLGAPATDRDAVAAEWEPAALLGTLLRHQNGTTTIVADIAQFEFEENPDGAAEQEDEDGNPLPDSNANAVHVTADGEVLVADAGGNTLLRVDPATGDIEVAAVFEERETEAPPFLGAPEGTMIPMQAVPTSIGEGPGGEILVGQLTGFPFPAGEARVYELEEPTVPTGDEEVTVYADGFSATHGVASRGDELFVVEMVRAGLLTGFQTGDFTGALVRVRPDGTRIALLRDVLQAPTGLATGPDDLLYITNGGIFPGGGSVIRFDPSQAGDPAIQEACPPDEVEGNDLSDITDTTHEEAITCAVWQGIFEGFEDGTYRPSVSITRGQLASTVARMIEAAGGELPEGEDRFSDEGETHGEAIESLAAAGVVQGFDDGTFRPGLKVSRAQAASIVVAGFEFATGEELAAGPDAFDDDDGSVHEEAINAAARAGWIVGVGEGTFAPHASLTRGQGASLLMRTISSLPSE